MLADNLNQKLTYWAPGELDGFGNPVWLAPVVIKCRWQDKQQLIRAKDGQEKVSAAQVWSEQVFDFNGRIAKGEFTTLEPVAGSLLPMAVGSLTDLDGLIEGYKTWL
jgi:hypothetical protein